MAFFRLVKGGDDMENGKLVHAPKSDLGLEKHLEAWLEKSPWAIAEESLLIIGRQTSATVARQTRYPDLLALDKDGYLVIVELKKGRTPREVVAQILEYAAWAEHLSEAEIGRIYASYRSGSDSDGSTELGDLFCGAFEADVMPQLNQHLRLFIAAEEISPGVASVCTYLRKSHGLDISCVKFLIYRTSSGEILVSSELVVGQEPAAGPGDGPGRDKSVRDIVLCAVQDLTGGDKSKSFSPKDVRAAVFSIYPNFKMSNVGSQIIADCVNHSSRHHYSAVQDLYWWVEKGKYKLYNPDSDK